MFGTDYLKIIGLPSDGTGSRPDLDNAPVGINGLVFKAASAQETYEHLKSIGVQGGEPVDASRPVNLDGEEKTARFQNINVKPGAFDGGRVYFCEHRTTELVWRPEYQGHANGVCAISQFTIVTRDPASVANDYAALLGCNRTESDDGYAIKTADVEILILSPETYGTRYGELASPTDHRPTLFGAIRFQMADLTQVKTCLNRTGSQLLIKRRRQDHPSLTRLRYRFGVYGVGPAFPQ